MRYFRKQLIALLDQTRVEQRIERLPPRLAACLVQDFTDLLPLKFPYAGVELRSRLFSHGDMHRHIITFRCPDQAFYLDAIKGYLQRSRIQPLMQQMLVLGMECDEKGCSIDLRAPGRDRERNFMFVALHFSATVVPDAAPMIRDIRAILQAVALSVRDFEPMQSTIARAVAHLFGQEPDTAALIEWLNDNRYIYFGLQVGERRLGIMRNRRIQHRIVPGLEEWLAELPAPEVPGAEWMHVDCTFRYLYSTASVEMFRLAWQERGKESLQWAVVVGHFSRTARYTSASRLPVLKQRWDELADAPTLRHSSFYQREVRMIFDRMSKPALLATRGGDWQSPIKAIVDISAPTDIVCELIRPDFGRLDILFIAMSADRFGPNTFRHLLDQLRREHGLIIHGHEDFGVGPHRLLLIYVDQQLADAEPIDALDFAMVRQTVHGCVIFWRDMAKANLFRHSRELDMPRALAELEAVSPLYMDLFPPEQFIDDLCARRQVSDAGRIMVRLQPRQAVAELHIISPNPMLLGDLVDRIRAFGLIVEREAVVAFGADAPQVHINCLQCRVARELDAAGADQLRRAVEAVLNDEADHDALNQLVVLAGLEVNQVGLIITLRNHLVQLMAAAAPLPLTEMLTRHATVSAALFGLFAARHAPDRDDGAVAGAQAAFDAALETVETLTHDTWFRALADLVNASLRSNLYVRGVTDPIAVKIAPQRLAFIPEPKPWREIFVHGVHVEGVHLRDGAIARGGIRHSDRHADFRTEVLELMATQTIKNGQIVPTGAKGGFVVRDGSHDAGFVRQQYRTFIRTLLGITDTLVDNQAVAPAGIRIAAEDAGDPYLVVAADKGTARFSDDANTEAKRAGFWLGDAFASGGAHGYDHKAVGITARGAWVCVAHHFARLGQDACHDALSVVGIGDMGGDVFGNGMLLNPNIRLIGAFNHLHIFLDPEPDTVKSFFERQRLFAEGAGWDGYDKRLLSRGGGIFERSAKSIPLSEEARTALGIRDKRLSGEALIRAMLQAPVDLVYNGGIGTYVKASSETHADVRDPANNAVRVNGADLRCRVVGEGGNLGFTQQARLEFALKGGVINTDALDNSAGVDMSDHEVNLKILFAATTAGRIGLQRRNRLLAGLTDEVTGQCLGDNLMQSRALTTAELEAKEHPHRTLRLMRMLDEGDWLDETTAASIDKSEQHAMRPLLAVLLGQEKNRLRGSLADESFHHGSCFASELLESYFPGPIRRRFAPQLAAHPLADEIIHTQAANHIVNHLGLTSVVQLQTLLDQPVGDIVEALLISEALLDGGVLRDAIWQYVGDVNEAAAMQRIVHERIIQFAEELLRLCDVSRLDHQWLSEQRQGFRRFRHRMAPPQGEALAARAQQKQRLAFVRAGLPDRHAVHLAQLSELAQFACAVHLAAAGEVSLQRCLRACRAGMELLPFALIEHPLRSPDWGGEETHALRRELLHRLTHQKHHAVARLLESRARDLMAAGERLWGGHHDWAALQAFRLGGEVPAGETAEERRMQLLLLQTQLEAVIEEG